MRCYERRGLIAEPQRSPGGHRAYPPGTVTLLTVIKAAQRLGFTLEEVAESIDPADVVTRRRIYEPAPKRKS
ncbi:MerR family transcriptional regulator [Herbidospora mongoliensis]|uniref:MerR family transcriptional regulator n=1 Tax=Herbidospora mongoliensis TaxID=688067 RepID=UPI001FDEE7E0|nr:MerR family transcriptional regulator [Herbidospora mongoliensis]